MKRIFLIIATTLLTLTVAAQAQETTTKKSMTDLKLSYIQSQNILSEAEFAAYSSVYKEYAQARRSVRRENRQLKKDLNSGTLSDQQAGETLIKLAANKTKLAQIYEAYLPKFTAAVSVSKYIKVKEAEDQFRKQILKHYRDKKSQATTETVK